MVRECIDSGFEAARRRDHCPPVDRVAVGYQDERLPELFTAEEWQVLTQRLGLSKRQAQIAQLICKGFKNRPRWVALQSCCKQSMVMTP